MATVIGAAPSLGSVASAGVKSAVADFEKAASEVVEAALTAAYEVSLSEQAKGLPLRDPDLVRALVDMDMAKYRAAASIKVARTADEIMGTLLSIKR